jgi:hypothetical protein
MVDVVDLVDGNGLPEREQRVYPNPALAAFAADLPTFFISMKFSTLNLR